MKAAWWGIGGVGMGAGLMYWADPRSGRWRRAHLQGRAVHAAHEASGAVGIVARDLSHRTRGVFFESFRKLRSRPVDDVTLEERVRSALGRVCSHPGAVHVSARDGTVVLEGAILLHELKRVVPRIGRVRGVRGVDNRLNPYPEPGTHPDLQGGVARLGEAWPFIQNHWSPTARLFGTLGGLTLTGWGFWQRGLIGTLAGLGGLVLGIRALTNLDAKRLTGVGAGTRAITLQKDITVNAPVEEVFAFWSAMQNFPRFMTHVDEVRVSDDERSHWRVQGPAGTHFEWDAIITKRIPNQVLAWRSVKGTMVKNSGIIHFEPTPGGGTRVDIRLSYNPPAGAIGHAFAKLLGADPKKQMDDDLLRFKSLLERGKATGHETVTREQLAPGRTSPTTMH
ncbi:SRPBCC family protein [Myxococcus sp. RHSTA-1-4]|uniref:SRPBCC family protein n=1 Tax=Myxococcus sp. RHSTA-1-4 TaxID=2874601 RepID=UPI001CBEA82E|nr:SRPBCC family protein [Myxococcus sp. RHSTA-1-4]MBZ4420908.1 SRPBCC family protein [Myxococcus sp. RHSTA-1-4]